MGICLVFEIEFPFATEESTKPRDMEGDSPSWGYRWADQASRVRGTEGPPPDTPNLAPWDEADQTDVLFQTGQYLTAGEGTYVSLAPCFTFSMK